MLTTLREKKTTTHVQIGANKNSTNEPVSFASIRMRSHVSRYRFVIETRPNHLTERVLKSRWKTTDNNEEKTVMKNIRWTGNTYIITDCVVNVRWYFDDLWAICAGIVCKAPRIAETGGRITLCCHFVLLCEIMLFALFGPLFFLFFSLALTFSFFRFSAQTIRRTCWKSISGFFLLLLFACSPFIVALRLAGAVLAAVIRSKCVFWICLLHAPAE